MRLVAGHQQPFRYAYFSDAEPRWVGDLLEFVRADFAIRQRNPWRNRQEFFQRDFPVVKSVHRDAVSGAASLSEWIGERRHRRVQMFSIQRKRQSKEVRLMRPMVQPGIGKIGEIISSSLQHRWRL